jgi:hypothetical protein
MSCADLKSVHRDKCLLLSGSGWDELVVGYKFKSFLENQHLGCHLGCHIGTYIPICKRRELIGRNRKSCLTYAYKTGTQQTTYKVLVTIWSYEGRRKEMITSKKKKKKKKTGEITRPSLSKREKQISSAPTCVWCAFVGATCWYITENEILVAEKNWLFWSCLLRWSTAPLEFNRVLNN